MFVYIKLLLLFFSIPFAFAPENVLAQTRKKSMFSGLEFFSPTEKSFFKYLGFNEPDFDEELVLKCLERRLRDKVLLNENAHPNNLIVVSIRFIVAAPDVNSIRHSVFDWKEIRLLDVPAPKQVVVPGGFDDFGKSAPTYLSIESLVFKSKPNDRRIVIGGIVLEKDPKGTAIKTFHSIETSFEFINGDWSEQENRPQSEMNEGKEQD